MTTSEKINELIAIAQLNIAIVQDLLKLIQEVSETIDVADPHIGNS